MLQYEITRKQLLEKQQNKIEALEARAAELAAQKVEAERSWAAAQRERELQKVRACTRARVCVGPRLCVLACWTLACHLAGSSWAAPVSPAAGMCPRARASAAHA